MITKTDFDKHMKKLTYIPEGFTLTKGTEPKWGNTGGWVVYTLKSETVELKFSQLGDGSTNFLYENKWLTFDQLGVSASFYHMSMYKGDRVASLNTIVKQQLKRIAERLEYYKTALSVPGTNFTVPPQRLQQMKKELTSGKPVTFLPSGFGTGVVFTMTRSRLNKPATAAQLEFFGTSQLYVETFECD